MQSNICKKVGVRNVLKDAYWQTYIVVSLQNFSAASQTPGTHTTTLHLFLFISTQKFPPEF